MLDTTTGEVATMTLKHEGNNVREFYSKLPRPVRVGIEATGSVQRSVSYPHPPDFAPARSSPYASSAPSPLRTSS